MFCLVSKAPSFDVCGQFCLIKLHFYSSIGPWGKMKLEEFKEMKVSSVINLKGDWIDYSTFETVN